jgi:hypothetical protein
VESVQVLAELDLVFFQKEPVEILVQAEVYYFLRKQILGRIDGVAWVNALPGVDVGKVFLDLSHST